MMRQTLALLLVVALVGTALAEGRREMPERRRKEMAKKYATMKRVQSLDPAAMRTKIDFRRTQELTQKAQKAGMDGLREKFNNFKAPSDELNKLRNRVAAGGARMAAQMSVRSNKEMKKSFMRKPVF